MEKTKKYTAMSVAGFVFGLLCFIFSFTVITAPMFGGLSICFSILSRGDKHMDWLAKIGLIFSIVGIVLAYFLGIMVISSMPGFWENIFERLYSWTNPAEWLGSIPDYTLFRF